MEAALWLVTFVSAGTAIGGLLCRLLYVNWKAAHQEPQMASAREVSQRPVGDDGTHPRSPRACPPVRARPIDAGKASPGSNHQFKLLAGCIRKPGSSPARPGLIPNLKPPLQSHWVSTLDSSSALFYWPS